MTRLFYYLSLLNIVDAFVTYYGLEKGYITEMNPLMNNVYEANSVLFVLIKLSLSLLLFLFIFFKAVPSTQIVKAIAVFASLLYTIVFMLHCVWLLSSL
ncbi:DUF5658 family protein [Bacillus sp. B15-48]|uniref:DUF5658 family protein n=1 Tax=Bacillus sp. B15-48 TaxID=1548601 RepID=UPI00193ED947|nr:DUF5658 family protein [Bacillus sp. B15-48]MBM4764485.1 hypothetical protein [Bacillus sp. B15-48]